MKKLMLLPVICGAALIATIAVLAFTIVSDSNGGSTAVQAAGKASPTPTTGPPKPTPNPGGNLSGIYDVLIPIPVATNSAAGAGPSTCSDTLDNGGDGTTDSADLDCQNKVIGLYHCIASQDHRTDNSVKLAVFCYADNPLLDDPTSVGIDLPGEGHDWVAGPPPPPPYGGTQAKGDGSYNPGTGTLTNTTCFESNASTGNIIFVTYIPNVKAQEAMNGGKAGGTLQLYTGQSDAQCDALAPDDHGGALLVMGIQTTRASSGNSPIRPGPQPGSNDADYDGDGCTDEQELSKFAEKCGYDPYNPLDGTAAIADMSGSYNITVTALEADCTKTSPGSPCTPTPGAFFSCLADVQETTATNDLTLRAACYIDNPLIPVNPQAGPEPGDGFSGGMPPKPYGDVDSEHTQLTGYVDKVKNTFEFSGCFKDLDGAGALGDVYVQSHWVDRFTLQGEIWVYILQPDACAGSPVGAPFLNMPLPFSATRQATKAVERDTDADGCSNKRELSDSEGAGGLRDPVNHWDYFNPTHDGLNRVDDILAVVAKYFIDRPNVNYTRNTDRTSIVGANPWNFAQPNGQQRVDDILAAVKSYFHDCSGGTLLTGFDNNDQFDYADK